MTRQVMRNRQILQFSQIEPQFFYFFWRWSWRRTWPPMGVGAARAWLLRDEGDLAERLNLATRGRRVWRHHLAKWCRCDCHCIMWLPTAGRHGGRWRELDEKPWRDHVCWCWRAHPTNPAVTEHTGAAIPVASASCVPSSNTPNCLLIWASRRCNEKRRSALDDDERST